MKDTEVLESFNNAWEAMCRQYKEYQREEMRVALNMLGKIIAKVKSEVEESHKESQITIDEWLTMINERLEEKMNREILFKAKRKDNGEWVEGGYFCEPYTDKEFIIRWNSFGLGYNEFIEIDPETLCQYTGLTDKNGQKIWENDICDRKEKYPEIVTYNKGDWQLDYSYALGKEMHYNACNLGFYVCERNCVEVIGNIFDNPELLEV